jgi:hypothetical protein
MAFAAMKGLENVLNDLEGDTPLNAPDTMDAEKVLREMVENLNAAVNSHPLLHPEEERAEPITEESEEPSQPASPITKTESAPDAPPVEEIETDQVRVEALQEQRVSLALPAPEVISTPSESPLIDSVSRKPKTFKQASLVPRKATKKAESKELVALKPMSLMQMQFPPDISLNSGIPTGAVDQAKRKEKHLPPLGLNHHSTGKERPPTTLRLHQTFQLQAFNQRLATTQKDNTLEQQMEALLSARTPDKFKAVKYDNVKWLGKRASRHGLPHFHPGP